MRGHGWSRWCVNFHRGQWPAAALLFPSLVSPRAAATLLVTRTAQVGSASDGTGHLWCVKQRENTEIKLCCFLAARTRHFKGLTRTTNPLQTGTIWTKATLPHEQKVFVLPWEGQGLLRALGGLGGPGQPYLGFLPTPPPQPKIHFSSAVGLWSFPEPCWGCPAACPSSWALCVSWLDRGAASVSWLCLEITSYG